ncbi:MAG: DNA-3-methyladenine glycosylase 2 family protein [Xanthomonadales bacterium]|nr:DNA-3-methyladenine glycosylase 2 family protein [Xanthomonadales bacterium]
MSRRKYNWDEAVTHLRARCDRLAGFIDEFGPRRLPIRREGSLFSALARAVAYQQLSGKAAGTIHGRFKALFPDGQPSAERTLDLSHDTLRSVGLSNAKALSIRDLAEHAVAGTLPTPWQAGRMSDEELIARLSAVRGIGPWTAQMYLIFNLGRPDVMPATDLGVQKGVQYIYNMRRLPDPKAVTQRTRHLAPFRSAASWYFWRASEWT